MLAHSEGFDLLLQIGIVVVYLSIYLNGKVIEVAHITLKTYELRKSISAKRISKKTLLLLTCTMVTQAPFNLQIKHIRASKKSHTGCIHNSFFFLS
jgi:hypothetical protein